MNAPVLHRSVSQALLDADRGDPNGSRRVVVFALWWDRQDLANEPEARWDPLLSESLDPLRPGIPVPHPIKRHSAMFGLDLFEPSTVGVPADRAAVLNLKRVEELPGLITPLVLTLISKDAVLNDLRERLGDDMDPKQLRDLAQKAIADEGAAQAKAQKAAEEKAATEAKAVRARADRVLAEFPMKAKHAAQAKKFEVVVLKWEHSDEQSPKIADVVEKELSGKGFSCLRRGWDDATGVRGGNELVVGWLS